MERTVTSLSLQRAPARRAARALPGARAGVGVRGLAGAGLPGERVSVELSPPRTANGAAYPTSDETTSVTSEWQAGLRWVVPLWRHVVWLIALGALLTIWVDIRVDVQQLRKDLDRSGRAFREARVHNDRLRIELDARKRVFALESAASALALTDGVRLIDVPDTSAGETLAEGHPAGGGN